MTGPVGSNKQRWLQRIRRRLQFGLFLKSFVDWTVAFCMVTGCILLATKLFWPQMWPNMLWVLAAVVPILIGAIWFSRRQSFRDDQMVAMLDKRIGAGGLLMTIIESPDDQWENQLPVADQIWKNSLPALRPVRASRHLAVPLVFLVFTCLIPPRAIQSLSVTPSAISRTEVSRLADMLKELEENEILEDEKEDEIKEQIEKLAKETHYSPLTHENWETVDALRQKMELELTNRENQLNQAASAIAALQRSMNDASKDSSAERKMLEQLMQDLLSPGSMNSNSSNRNGKNDKAGQKSPGKFSGNGKFRLPADAEALQKALDELNEFIESQCKNVGKCKGKKPCKCEGCKEGGTWLGGGARPGSGGISRGRGDAAITWGDESDEQGIKFREVAIPQGVPDQEGELLQTKITTPEANPVAPTGRTAAHETGNSPGGQAWKQNLRPRHREIVKKYFGSKSEK